MLREYTLTAAAKPSATSLLAELAFAVRDHLRTAVPLRFAVTGSDDRSCTCEVGAMDAHEFPAAEIADIFQLRRRPCENAETFNAALLVPTGIGAEIGGHAGDAAPVARLLAAECDTLVTHPNVVNASDINELPDNGLYVEGSVITQLLMGTAALRPVRMNRVLLVIAPHDDPNITAHAVNAASAARASMGMDCRILQADSAFRMVAKYSPSGRAAGVVEGAGLLVRQLLRRRHEFDAVAIASVIDVPETFHTEYFAQAGEMVNPWGGVEAMLTHAVSMALNVPVAHAPMVASQEILEIDVGVVDPRMAAEALSTAFLHCVLKGLHRSPAIEPGGVAAPGLLKAEDVSCLVIPDGCVGLPTLAAVEQGIPVIAVRENRNLMRNDLTRLPFAAGKLIIVDNYLEAAGVMAAMRAGVSVESVRRPLRPTVMAT